MELLCSTPLSVNYSLNSGCLSSPNNCRRVRRFVAFYPTSHRASSASQAAANVCSTSSSSSYFGMRVSRSCGVYRKSTLSARRSKRSFFVVAGVFERFTERAIKAVMYSQREAKALGRDMVYIEHLLLGLIEEDRAPNGFLGSGVKVDVARKAVQSLWKEGDQSRGSGEKLQESETSATDVPFSAGTKRVFEAAVEYSKTMGHNFISPEHMAIGLFTVDDGSADRVLRRLGVNPNLLADVAVSRLQGELAKDGREPASTKFKRSRENAQPEKVGLAKSSEKGKDKNALDLFCVDLTDRAGNGSIDPVIGRENEIKRVIQILGRRSKSNPILLGEAGVGKTAIAEGLALNIADGYAPSFLMKKRILSLDIGLLIAGAKERGELEERVTMLISEIKKSGNVILFIDEVHTLIGSSSVGRGNKGSGLDIANLLKPPLGRGEFQCIASTTMDEFRLHFEKDAALARRFQPVLVNEPSEDDAVQILLGLRDKYESHHRCVYTLEAINAAVQMSERYIPDRYLPDKAIDLIDEAGSRAHMDACKRKKENLTSVLSRSPSDYWQEIRAVQAMHEASLAAKLIENSDTRKLEEDGNLNIKSALPPSPSDNETMVIGAEDIATVASVWTGIPVKKITADERIVLTGLHEQLKKRVIGQDEAVDAICRAVKRSRVGLNDPDRPIAAMLFCGPTGVGKTELAKALAASYFGSESNMLRLDMTEYMERHTVSKLIGSPPGYVGYGEGGTLTEAIRRRPFTVLLLDEIEKAHPDVFNILLQLFEDGRLTDSQGRRVSFKNALILMTSNVGSAAIVSGRRSSFGFSIDNDGTASYAGLKALVIEELKTYFRPELLNRIDEVVIFRSLQKRQMLEILNVMLREVKDRLLSLGIGLEVSQAAMDLICEQGYDRNYGARSLRRAVTLLVEDLVSESLLSGDYKPGDIAAVDLDDSGNPIVTKSSTQKILLCDTPSLMNL